MDFIIGTLGAMSPWLIGATTAVNISLRSPRGPGCHAIAAAVGGYAGCLAMAFAVWSADQFQQTLLNRSVATAMCLIAIAGFLLLIPRAISNRRAYSAVKEVSATTKILITVLLVVVSIKIYFQYLLPAQGWDTLTFWSAAAQDFIIHSGGERQDSFSSDAHIRHPRTLIYLSAWSSWVFHEYSENVAGYWLWFSAWISLGLTVFGFSQHLNLHRNAVLTMTLSCLSFPLLENHAMVPGYSEIFLANSLIGSCALLALGKNYGSSWLLITATVVALSAVFIKNTGLFYFLLPLFGYVTVWFGSEGYRPLIFLLAVAAFISFLIVQYGLSFYYVLGNRISFDEQQNILYFAGRQLQFINPGIIKILSNQLYGWVLNNSFSLIPLALLVLPFSGVTRALNWNQNFFLLTTVLGLSFMVLSQFTDYGFRFATPSNDTGNSRSTMPVFVLALLTISSFLKTETLRSKC